MSIRIPFNQLSGHWLLVASTSVFCYFVVTAVYNIYFSPLSKFPGPFWAKISGLPSFYHATTGRRHIWIWQCHEIYGNAFRFHPNGVLFTTPTSYPSIYGTRANVKKGKFYEVWSRNEKNINTLSTVDKMAHARKRRILNSVFSERAIRSSESFIIAHVDRWCDILEEDANGGWTDPKNMSTLSESLVFDIMGDLSFGTSFNIKEKKANPLKAIPHAISEYMQFMYSISQSPILKWWVWMKPRGLDKVFELITPKEVKEYYDFVDASVMKRSKEEDEAQKLGLDKTSARKDMFHYLYNAKDPETGKPAYEPEELNAEANLLIIAGSDTTSTSLCSFFFYITRHPRAYDEVVREIQDTFSSVDEIQGGTKLSSCQYLRACLNEAMRLTPAGPSELIREVLPGGLEVDGKFIPEGIMVGVAHWAVLHSEENYGDPSTYRPERWIVDPVTGVTAEDVARAQSTFQPFSMGSGNCVGQKLAILELLITIGRTLYRMDVRRASGAVLGQGSPELGWGMRSKDQFQVKDAYITIKDGPLLQFKKRHVRDTPRQ